MDDRKVGLLLDPVEPKFGKIEFVHKDVDHPDWIVLADPVPKAFRKQRALPAIRALNEASNPIPRIWHGESYRENQIQRRVFTQPGSFATGLASGGKRGHSICCGRDRLPAGRCNRGILPRAQQERTR